MPSSNQEKIDYFYETLSDFLEKDAQLFFEAWGIPVSNEVREKVSEEYGLLTQKIWTYNPVQDTGGKTHISENYFYQNTNWTIADVNSQELTGENNGKDGWAKYLIDGNINTYWHSNYNDNDGGTTSMPFYVVVDMQKELPVKSFTFTQRQGNPNDLLRHIKNLEVSISDNGENWEIVDNFHLVDIQTPQSFNLSSEETFRYFKLKVNSTDDVYDGKAFATLAEVEVADTIADEIDPYNTAPWTAEASSIGDNGANEYDPPEKAIDGDINTFWSASWDPAQTPPYWIAIDMQKPLQVSSIHITQRQTGNLKSRVNEFTLYTSDDGNNWIKEGTYSLEDKEEEQTINLSSTQTFQYFKIEIEDKNATGFPNGGDEPAIAELSVNK